MQPRLLLAAASFLLALTTAGAAGAQATRTWVSGVGDDVNPCSRTAPCKTFAGAISKTAAFGEINALDSGGFGAVTITKSITIRADGVTAGVLAAGTNGVIVNAGANDVVVLRGLDIEGVGTGLNGVRFLAGGALHIEDCTIQGFTQSGISFAPSGASRLSVQDTVVRNNNPSPSGASYGGIFVSPAAGVLAEVSLERVRILRSFHGLRLQGNVRATARQCATTANAGTGVFVGFNSQLSLDGCEVAGNANGVRSDGANAIVRIANTLVSGNSLNGLLAANGGAIQSFGNNRIAGNGTNGAPTSTIPEN